MGNIIEVFENGRSACRYEYDALDRLTREDNVAFGKTTTWAYDNNGNIIDKYEYAITTIPTSELHLQVGTRKQYLYANNSDQLCYYIDETCPDTQVFSYDFLGNPSLYRGKYASWDYGRQLTEFDGNTFTYDARGRRISKNDIAFTYDSNGNLIKQSNGLEFFYDHTGVFAVKYNDSTYYYRKNAQQDIIALLDIYGNVVVKYKYDAWGMCKVLNASGAEITDDTHIGILNPFRYRSYYFDTETGFYFLKTRYYDPEIGRFMTIDDISYLDPESINGLNLYAYCGDNPVNRFDSTGYKWDWNKFLTGLGMVITAIGAIVLGVTTFGAGIPLTVAILAGVTIGAGVLTGINGVATMIESSTEYNFVRDGLFNKVLKLNDVTYNIYARVVEGIAIAGSMFLGFYHSTGQYKAAKASQKYLGKGYSRVEKNRWISADGLRQVRWDTTHHMYHGKPSPLHFNWYEYASPISSGIRGKAINEAHLWLKWFSYYI